ncbi:MAG: alpha/beta hydrolase [Bacillus subtilis]|nr:alpha/beta hydrolase [Bacillus subtilis]
MTSLHFFLIGIGIVFQHFLGSYYVYRRVIRINPKNNYAVVNQTDQFFAPSWEWFKSIPKETVHIRSYDGVRLGATFIPSPDNKSELLAIVLHGYHANSTDMAIIAKMYSDLNFKVLLIDQRGHGLSGGTFTSLGVFERYDLRKWINYCLRIYGSNDQILLHGVSMGAATVLMAAGLNLSENVKLLVADSAFTTFMKTLSIAAKPKIGILFFPGMNLISLFLHKFTLWQANVLNAVRKVTYPTVFIHSDRDRVCPLAMMERLYHAMPTTQKAKYIVKDAPHAEGYVADKAGIDAFLTDKIVQYFGIKKPKPIKK